jgi:hypothetical protein
LDFKKYRQSQNFLILAMLKEVVFWVFSKEFGCVGACKFFLKLIKVDLIVDVVCKVPKNIFDAAPK